MKAKIRSLETKVLNLHEIIEANQEENEEKQAASDADMKNGIRGLQVAYRTLTKLVGQRFNSERQVDSSAGTLDAKKSSKPGKSPEDSCFQSEDEDDKKLSPVHAATAKGVGKKSASTCHSEESGKEEESSSEDEDFDAVQKAIGN